MIRIYLLVRTVIGLNLPLPIAPLSTIENWLLSLLDSLKTEDVKLSIHSCFADDNELEVAKGNSMLVALLKSLS